MWLSISILDMSGTSFINVRQMTIIEIKNFVMLLWISNMLPFLCKAVITKSDMNRIIEACFVANAVKFFVIQRLKLRSFS